MSKADTFNAILEIVARESEISAAACQGCSRAFVSETPLTVTVNTAA